MRRLVAALASNLGGDESRTPTSAQSNFIHKERNMRKRWIFVAILLLGSVTLAGSSVSKPAAVVTPGPALAAGTVTISNFQFTPKIVRIKASGSVTWQVKEGTHTVNADDGSFGSSALSAGQEFSHEFTKPGTYRYYCSFHGSKGGHDMAGAVIVSR